MKRLLLIFSLVLLSARLLPCSCIEFKSFYWHYNYADIIFKGQVTKIIEPVEPRGRERKIIFKILEPLKGKFYSDTVLLKTGLGDGDCGLPVAIGDTWVIFSENRRASVCNMNIKLTGKDSSFSEHPFGIYNSKWVQESLAEISKGENKYIKEYNSKKQIIAEGLISNKVSQGLWKYHFDYNVGMPGVTDEKVFYKNGIKDSCECEYYKTKKLYAQRQWKNGRKNGKEVYYHTNGKIDMIRNYINGENDGEWKMFYENGALRERESYSNGIRVGVDLKLYENGDTSVVIYYNSNGKRTRSFSKYENGNFQWDDNSKYQDTICTEISLGFHENGKMRYSFREINNKRDGEQIMYFENGTIKEKKYYVLGKETGTWYFYDESGKLISEEKK